MDVRLRTNISQAAMDNFKLEQEKFLNAQLQFKSGWLFYGHIAAGLLTSMFYILPAGRQFKIDQENKTQVGADFINKCDLFRQEVFRYARRKGQDNPSPETLFPLTNDYTELDNQYDALVREFFIIMFDTGFSP